MLTDSNRRVAENRLEGQHLLAMEVDMEANDKRNDMDLLIQILERAQAKFERQNRCRVKELMRRLHRLAGVWLGEGE